MDNKSKKYMIICLALAVLSVIIGLSFAYINQKGLHENHNTNVSIDTSKHYSWLFTPSSSVNYEMYLSGEFFEAVNSGNSANTSVNVTVKLNSDETLGSNFGCDYDVIYENTSDYVNTSNYLEYTISGTSSLGDVLNETGFPRAFKNESVLLATYYIQGGQTASWNFLMRFYNLEDRWYYNSSQINPPSGIIKIKEKHCGVRLS